MSLLTADQQLNLKPLALKGFSIACCIGSVVRLMIGLPMIMQNDDYQGQFPFNPLFFVFSAIYFAFHTVASFALVPAVKEISCTLYDNAMALVILTFLIEVVAAYGREMFFIPNLVMLFVDVVLDITGIIVISTKFGKALPYEDFLTSGLVIGCIILPILVRSSMLGATSFKTVSVLKGAAVLLVQRVAAVSSTFVHSIINLRSTAARSTEQVEIEASSLNNAGETDSSDHGRSHWKNLKANFNKINPLSTDEPLQKSKFTGQQRMQASEHSDSDAGSGTIV